MPNKSSAINRNRLAIAVATISIVTVLLLLEYITRERPLITLPDVGYRVELISWSPTGQYLATSATNGMVQIYDVESWQPITSFSSGRASNRSMKWLSDEMIEIAQANYVIQIWDITLPSEVYHIDLKTETEAQAANGWRFSLTDLGSNVGIFAYDLRLLENQFFTGNMETGEFIHHRELSIVTWDVQGTNIAFMTTENEIMTFDLNTGQTALVVHDFDSQGSGLVSMAWSPDSKYIALVTRDRRLRIWDVLSGSEKANIALTDDPARGFGGSIALAGGTDIQWSNDGTRIAFGNGGVFYIVSLASQSVLCSTQISARQALYGPLDWTDDGRYVLGTLESTNDGVHGIYDVGIWETETCQSERFIPVGFSWTSRWDTFGTSLAVINREQQVEIWSISEAQ